MSLPAGRAFHWEGEAVKITVIRPAELGAAEINAWRDMQRSSESLANPFLSPEFAIAVGQVRQQARVAVLSDGGVTAGFFPFERRSLGLGVPIAAGLTDCQGLVHAPGVEWDPRGLLRACRVSVWEFDHLTAGQLPFRPYQSAVAASPAIDLTGGFDSYFRKLRVGSPSLCATVARKGRKLGREVGEVRFDLTSQDPAALRLLMSWLWALFRRPGRPDRFSQPWTVDLLESLAAARGPHFSGVLSVLYAGELPVAVHFGIRSGDVLAYWFPAYDTAYGRYSPGLLSLLRLARDGAAQGVGLIDLGKGAMRYKEDMKSTDLYVGEGIVTCRSPLAAAHRVRAVSVQKAVRTIRGNPRLFRAADWVLRQYARTKAGGIAPRAEANEGLSLCPPPAGTGVFSHPKVN